MSIDVIAIEARTVDEIEPAFAAIGRERADALFVAGDPVFNGVPDEIVSLAARRKLPSIYQDRNAVLAGGLISYGIDQRALFRQAASYIDKLLKGEKPGELPVQQPTKFELVINLKTANTLGLTIPKIGIAEAKVWAAADDPAVFAELDAKLVPKEGAGRNWRPPPSESPAATRTES